MTFNRFNDFLRQLGNKEHDMDSDALTIALTNIAPVATNAYLSSLTEIVYTGVSGSRVLQNKVWAQALGVAKFSADDLVLTGTGSGFGPFRYVVLFNDTPSTAATKGLIGWIDYLSSITVPAGNPFTIDFDGTNGIFTLG